MYRFWREMHVLGFFYPMKMNKVDLKTKKKRRKRWYFALIDGGCAEHRSCETAQLSGKRKKVLFPVICDLLVMIWRFLIF